MSRFIGLLCSLIFTVTVMAGEFQLSTMGRAQFLFPDPEVDYWLNAAYLSHVNDGYWELGSRFQNTRLPNSYITIIKANDVASTLPDEYVPFNQLWQTRFQGIQPTRFGVLGFRVQYDRLEAPEFNRNIDDRIAPAIYPPIVYITGNQLTIQQWQIELAFARQLSQHVSIGIRAIPVGQRFLPDFYQLLPISLSDADLLSTKLYQYWQGGIVSQLNEWIRLGISLEWERYQWQGTSKLAPMPWYFQRMNWNLLSDIQLTKRSSMRLWFRLQHPEFQLPLIPNTAFIASENYEETRPLTAIKTLAVAYNFQTDLVGISLGLVNDWGTVEKTTFVFYSSVTGKEMRTARRTFEVYQRYLTVGLSLAATRHLTVRSGLVFGSKGYGYYNTTFHSVKNWSITRVPTVGISWTPNDSWQVDAGVLPIAGGEIVNSSLNAENLYQLSIRYHLK